MHLDLSDDETAALVALLTRTIDDDPYSLSPRLGPVKSILAKLRPEPVREPLPPPKVYAPPRAVREEKRRVVGSANAERTSHVGER
jgi:hypothetical protein